MIAKRFQFIVFGAFTLVAVWLGGCSSGGFLQPSAESGVIQMTLVGPETLMSPSALTSPVAVGPQFVVNLSETNYHAQFTVAIDSYTAPVVASCYVASMDSTGTFATFTLRSPAPAPVPGAASSNPCVQPGSDTENAVFVDQQNHQASVYFRNMQAAPTPTPTPYPNATGILALYNGTLLSTMAPMPTYVTSGFSVTVSEASYTGPFTATIVSYTAPTSAPCYMVTMDATGKTAVFTPKSVASPCPPAGMDTEGVRFQDTFGVVSPTYYFAAPTASPSPSPTPTATPTSM